MHIEIDYNGSIAKCTISDCMPTANCPNVNPHKTYNLNNADKLSQIIALNAFNTIAKQLKRELNNK